MPFVAHLAELRRRLIIALLALGAGMVIAFFLYNRTLSFLVHPYCTVKHQVQPGSTCVVFGAGMVGLGAVAGCRLQAAERIVCVDLSEERLALARGQGATDTLAGGPDVVQAILDMTGGFGADYTFEATGLVSVMRQAVEAARMGWGLATVCGVAGKGETLDVIPRYLITGRRIAGSSFGGVKGRDQVPQLVQRYLDGDIDVDAFISHRLSLDDVNRGFELMEAQDGIRSVISMT